MNSELKPTWLVVVTGIVVTLAAGLDALLASGVLPPESQVTVILAGLGTVLTAVVAYLVQRPFKKTAEAKLELAKAATQAAQTAALAATKEAVQDPSSPPSF